MRSQATRHCIPSSITSHLTFIQTSRLTKKVLRRKRHSRYSGTLSTQEMLFSRYYLRRTARKIRPIMKVSMCYSKRDISSLAQICITMELSEKVVIETMRCQRCLLMQNGWRTIWIYYEVRIALLRESMLPVQKGCRKPWLMIYQYSRVQPFLVCSRTLFFLFKNSSWSIDPYTLQSRVFMVSWKRYRKVLTSSMRKYSWTGQLSMYCPAQQMSRQVCSMRQQFRNRVKFLECYSLFVVMSQTWNEVRMMVRTVMMNFTRLISYAEAGLSGVSMAFILSSQESLISFNWRSVLIQSLRRGCSNPILIRLELLQNRLLDKSLNQFGIDIILFNFQQCYLFVISFFLLIHIRIFIINFCILCMNQFEKLIKFVKKGELEKVSEILQQATLNINDLDPKSGKSLLQISMESENDQIFNMLIKYPGIDVQKPSRDGQLQLETAVILNSTYYVEQLLLTGNINPKKMNINQQTILQIAIKQNTSKDILRKLIHYKFDINQPVNQYGNLLNLAIVNRQLVNFMFLINYATQKDDHSYAIKINTLDQNDNTCLILAVQYVLGDAILMIFDFLTRPECTLTDLEKQFFVNAQNKQGNTAFHLACIKDLQTISQIIQKIGKDFGMDVNLKNKKGQTPFDIRQLKRNKFVLEKQLKQKNQQEKRIYLKEKEQEKQRRKQQQQRAKAQQKRKKKQQELFLLKQQQYEKELKFSKTKWVCGILVVLLIGSMYLVLLNTVQSKKNAQL